jgi:hypothetical protein
MAKITNQAKVLIFSFFASFSPCPSVFSLTD